MVLLWTSPDISLSFAIGGRKHGEFLHIGENWYYSNGGSLNGTFLNEEKLTGNTRSVVLNDGVILRIDSQNLERPDKGYHERHYNYSGGGPKRLPTGYFR